VNGTAQQALEVTAQAETPALTQRQALESSRRGYRLFAPLYDLVFGASLQHGRRVAVAALDCRPGEKVLELGIGSGLSLALYPADAEVVGIDLSEEMLALARRRLARLPARAPRTLLAMNAERLELADASFDKAIVLFAIAGLPDPVRALRELRRVCKPGARLVIANRFRSASGRLRVLDVLLSPLFRLLRYRADLDGEAIVRAAGFELLESRPVNLFGYSTVLVCRSA
jgi:phosphatidylethanolamine/phosphatidyl-N-methylethanolamine N-methyltransferase